MGCPDLAAINGAVKIEAEMYKSSVVLFILLHLFIFCHLPHPTPTAAMSVTERTYIMVKVSHSELVPKRSVLTIVISPTVSSADSSATSSAASSSVASSSLLSSSSMPPPSTSRSVSNVCNRFPYWQHLTLCRPADYADLKGKPFFPGLIQYMASGPVVAMVWQGLDAVKTGRVMLGATNPLASAPG